MGTFGLILLLVFATVPPLVDYLLVSRAGGSEMRSLARNWELRRIFVTIVFADALAAISAGLTTSIGWPGGAWTWLLAGLSVMAVGYGLRFWAIHTLGRFFRFVVTIASDHRVVREGPYRVIRHPGYAGLLLTQAGFGIALGNPLSLFICLTVPITALMPRIRSEESALRESLGAEYGSYAEGTARLVPGLW